MSATPIKQSFFFDPIPYPEHCLPQNYKEKLDDILPKLRFLSQKLNPFVRENVLGGSIAIVLHILNCDLPDDAKCELIKFVVNPDPEKNTNVDFYIGHQNDEEYLALLRKFQPTKTANSTRTK